MTYPLIDAESQPLADMLRARIFSIPWHQRLYAWDKEHVEELLDDLAEAVKENLPCHFLGSVMLIEKDGGRWEINDGQQRIITYSLICACLCKRFFESGRSMQEGDTLRLLFDIQEGHGKSLSDAKGMGMSPRIKIPASNAQNFYNLISGEEVSTNGPMVSAWETINAFLDKNSSLQRQVKFTDFLLNNVVIVRLVVDKKLDINAIFETLNDRGKHLTQTDLIKNYILACFQSDSKPDRMDHVNKMLESIYTLFRNNMDNISEYMRCYLQVKYGFIKAQKLFKVTKETFSPMASDKRKDEVFDLVNNMSIDKKIAIFKILLRKGVGEDFLDQLTTDARKTRNLRQIQDYLLDLRDYTITRPISFALFCRYAEAGSGERKEIARFVYSCMKILSSFVQRIAHTQGAFTPSHYEEKFANIGRAIFFKECNSADSFFNRIKNCDINGIIDDKAYINLMSSVFYQTKSDNKLKHILRCIVEYQDREIRINDTQDSVEHIFPKGREHQEEWGFTPDECAKLTYCLGNLTLLHRKDNSPKKEDNKNFHVKKEIFVKSSLTMTKDLCQHEEWTPDIIVRRQRELAKIAGKEIWNFVY